MKNNLFAEFCNIHPEFLGELATLDKSNKNKFENKLKREKQKVNFLSTISEFKFAQFMQSEKVLFEYEPKIDNRKTPDFRIFLPNKIIGYFDTKRFNISDTDRANNDIVYQLATKLKTIQKPYYIDIEQVSEITDIKIDLVSIEFEKWLCNSVINAGDTFFYNNSIKIKVVKTNGIRNNILYIYGRPDPKIHPSKIKSDIIQKLKTYKETIIQKGFPFFIAIDLTFDTLRDPEDYWLFFLGGSCENIDTGTESFLLGEFYKDDELNGLTGLLIRYNQILYWLKNPRNRFSIEFKNVELECKLKEA